MLVDPGSGTNGPGPSPHDGDDKKGSVEPVFGTASPAKKLLYLVAVLALGVLAFRLIGPFGVSPLAPPPAEKAQPLIRSGESVFVPEHSPLRGRIAVVPVPAKDIQRNLVLPAAVEADPARLIKVAPPVAGRVTQLKVQLGERVQAGQPLVVIDSPDLGTAYSDYDRAKALLALARTNRDRQRGLAKIGGAAEKDLQQAEADYVTADAEFKRALARLNQIGVEAETSEKARTVTVVAPMAGSIIDLGVAPGQYWNDATAPLMTVADLDTIWVTANVPEKDIALVSRGQAVEVVFAAYPKETFKGNVLFVSDVVDSDTRRSKVRIAFDNPDTRLRPGMFATVSFVAPAQRVPVVPASALIPKDDATQVFVETAPWTFAPRNVTIGFQQGDDVVLSDGVKPGDRVVVKGGVLLGD
jgi:cobalt-zinc-cadmium efflux system membrane fusion protein